jgi:predicted ATPase
MIRLILAFSDDGSSYTRASMIISKVILKNWRNFEAANVDLAERVFVVGPNASGKSNFLDVFKFLRDIALPRGGLQEAITLRGGVPRIRCLSARKETDVGVTVEFKNSADATFSVALLNRDQARTARTS